MRKIILIAAIASLPFLIGACGGGSRVPKKATVDMKKVFADLDAAISRAQSDLKAGQHDSALEIVKGAKETVTTVRARTGVREARMLDDYSARLSALQFDIEKARAEAAEKKAVAEAPKTPEVLSPEEEKRRKEAEAEKARQEQEKRKTEGLEALTTRDTKKVEKKGEPEEEPAKKKVPGGEGEKEPGKAGAEEKKQEGPFAPVDENTPEVRVDKVEAVANCMVAYVTLVNKWADKGRVVGKIEATFKTKGNAPLGESMVAYLYDGFKPNAGNLYASQGTQITAGNVSIFARGYKHFVVIGDSDKSKDVAKADVRVIWEDGDTGFGSGP
ncbi:MAG: hypothetical protein N3A38_06305 [Planctomycetota bacterium]|nr:hypothetical protein [Planctomycetota bacterium]